MSRLKALTGIAFIFLASVCQAQTLLDTDPVSPVSTDNQIDITFSALGATDTQTVSILTGSQVGIDPTFASGTLQTLEHTGGQLAFSDATFTLDFGFLFGQLTIDTMDLEATLVSLPLPVIDDGNSGGSYDLIGQQFIFNDGTIVFSGAQSGMVDFATDPESITLQATPSSIVATDLFDGTHELFNTILLDSIDTLDFNGVPVQIEVDGSIISRGLIDSSQITAVPEPSSGVMVVMAIGFLAIRRRKR